ncbi:unnamed protein product [Paramecium sonneborni]|uniref:RRM domain-containing protein n=1 Tax=Paramecium sonneborni TaxID=65129 RepID=A0A8S1LCU6_9CILI|nr:unnamed protein product [Paramecium sonneborni]
MSELEYVNLEKGQKGNRNRNNKQFNGRGRRGDRFQSNRGRRPVWKQRQTQQRQQQQHGQQQRQNRFRRIPTGQARRQRINRIQNRPRQQQRERERGRDRVRDRERDIERIRNREEQRSNNNRERERERDREVISKGPRPNVIVRGLDPHQTETGLREFCSQYGPMEMCKLERDNFGNVKPEGIGLIRFFKQDNAELFVSKVDGEVVNVNGDDKSLRRLSAKLVGQNNKNSDDRQTSGILKISRGPIQKSWRR